MDTELLVARKALIDAAVALETARGSDPALAELSDTLDAAVAAYVELKSK